MYTPQEVMDLVSGRFPRDNIKVQGRLIWKNGFVKLSDGRAEIDVDGVDGLDISVGSLVEIDGFLSYRISGSGIYVKLRKKEIRVIEDTGESLAKELSELVRTKKTHRGFYGYVQGLLTKEEVLKVVVIHGRGAQVHRDFQNALYNSSGAGHTRVELSFIESGLSDEELAQTLSELDTSYHMVFVLRGGGSEEELSRIGGIKSAQVVVEKDIPLYLALGHSLDKNLSLLEKVAEHSFPTPSIAGQELGKLINLHMSLASAIEQYKSTLVNLNTANQRINTLSREKEFLERELEKLKQSQGTNLIYILIAIAIGFVLGLVAKNFL